MNITKRHGVIFAAGLVLVAMVVAVAWRVVDSRPASKMENAAPELQSSALIASPQAFTCQVQPTIAAVSEKDGQFPFQPDLSGLSANEIGSFIVIGKESASAGRPRDAETAFLMACRLAEKFRGTGSLEIADAKYQLGWHYAAIARQGSDGSSADIRAVLLERVQLLYPDSLGVYQAKFGDTHEKSLLAAEGMAWVRQTLAQAAPLSVPSVSVAAGRASEPVRAAVAGHSAATPARGLTPRKAKLAKAASPPRQGPNPAASIQPSFDCRRARSKPEKLICSDAELAELDRELGRVYARARKATSDRTAFQRQQNQEWLRRESSCRDRDCLLRWYEVRRDQLMNEIEGRRQSSATASR
ncbi:MAG: hypothetical protein GZ092_06595 [Polaromonas sp.]|nr:hypothetical protein [Polaromonas sp.]